MMASSKVSLSYIRGFLEGTANSTRQYTAKQLREKMLFIVKLIKEGN